MNPKWLTGLIAAAALVLLFCIYRLIDSRIAHRRILSLLDDIFHGNLDAIKTYPLTETQTAHLFHPFTLAEMERFAPSLRSSKIPLYMELILPRMVFWGFFFIHVERTIDVVDQDGLPASMVIVANKEISLLRYYSLWRPLYLHVKRKNKASRT